MADTSDDKKAANGAGGDAAYDVLEKDFQEVGVNSCCLFRTRHTILSPAQLASFAFPSHIGHLGNLTCRFCQSFSETSRWSALGRSMRSCSKL